MLTRGGAEAGALWGGSEGGGRIMIEAIDRRGQCEACGIAAGLTSARKPGLGSKPG
jgi:hypothetical protein